MKSAVNYILPIFVLWSANALAESSYWDYSLGLKIEQLSFAVYEKDGLNPVGILTEAYSFTHELGVESQINYLSDSHWGYKYAISLGQIKMNTQEVDLADVDLNTSAEGYFFYAMPVAVYNFYKDRNDSSLILGFGYGLGYLNIKGDLVFTSLDPQQSHDFNLSNFTSAYGLFIEYEKGDWGLGINMFGPEINNANFDYNLYDFGGDPSQEV